MAGAASAKDTASSARPAFNTGPEGSQALAAAASGTGERKEADAETVASALRHLVGAAARSQCTTGQSLVLLEHQGILKPAMSPCFMAGNESRDRQCILTGVPRHAGG